MKKRLMLCMLCIFILTGMAGTAGCGREQNQKQDPGNEATSPEAPTPELSDEVHIMNGIEYELTANRQQAGEDVVLTLPHPNGLKTGTEYAAQVLLNRSTNNFNYYVVDWGDGTWSYNGPFVNSDTAKVTGEVRHAYRKAGEYQVKATAVNLEYGRQFGWTETKTVKVSGNDFSGDLIADVFPFSSSAADGDFGAGNVADGVNGTVWKSAPSDDPSTEEYVGYIFKDHYTLDTIEIKFPADAETFPSNISIDYTTDGGKVWYMLPHYYYVLPNSEGYYTCDMGFPDPKGATLSLPLDGIAANGIRIRCVNYPSYSTSGNTFSVAEMRVYGKKGTFFYTSYEGYYDADLSNMWTIFGTAKTEPNVYNSLSGAGQNPEQFRSGETMIASVEWTAWNGAQLNWSGYTEAIKIHVNSLKTAVYGGDGWYYDEEKGKYVVDTKEYKSNPNDDGFIWATSSAPQHLDAQNHYTNNSSLIIAARDFLLTGNDTEGFLSSTNAKKQVMLDKLRKAMEYMLKNLNGESGLMTIYDPRNDGTVYGVSSNYWDSLNFFGYNSAYENVLFYQSVLAMADIESYAGNASEAARYTALAAKIKAKFNDYFWDNSKGRYITSVNIKGDVLDFGITFVNFMAVAAGLASEEQAKQIYDWVDGKRIIDTDTSKGGDIYNFKVSARANTVAVETIEEDGLHYWWYNGHSFNDVKPGHWGEYGNQMQNGGTIFYTSYYDIAGRTMVSGDCAIGRFNEIMAEFHIDSLRRAPRPIPGNFYQVSIVGEFPESGLVPLSFLTAIIGVTPEVKGLKIQSCLPSDMTYAGVREYNYANRQYTIEVNKELSAPEMTQEGDRFVVRVPADKTFYITADNALMEG